MVSAPTKPLKSPYITHMASFLSQNSPMNSVDEAISINTRYMVGPAHCFAYTPILPPLLADCGQVVRKSERRTAAIIPCHYLNVPVWKSDAGIDGRDAVVIPVGDLAKENIGVN